MSEIALAYKHKGSGDVHIMATDDKGNPSQGAQRLADNPDWEPMTDKTLKSHLGKDGLELMPQAVRDRFEEPKAEAQSS